MAVSCQLKVVRRARVRKERRLPTPGTVLVGIGDSVRPETVLARADYVRGNPYIIDLGSELGFKPEPSQVESIVLKRPGDVVAAGEIIARHQRSFWEPVKEIASPVDGRIEFVSKTRASIIIREDPRSAKPMSIVAVASRLRIFPRFIRAYTTVKEGDTVFEGKIIAAAPSVMGLEYVYAPTSGVVEKICPRTGTITIVRPIKSTTIVAGITGRVVSVIPDEGAVVEGSGAYVQGVFGVGGEHTGPLRVVAGGPESVVTRKDTPGDVEGQVLLGGAYVTVDALEKARSSGAAGFITGGASNLDVVQLLGREISLGVTGVEDVDFTLILLEGFGVMPVSESTWTILKEREGSATFVDGSTQIRAGVIRPEIIVCDDVPAEDAELPVLEGKREGWLVETKEVSPGDRVRCVMPPYMGSWGTVEEIPSCPEQVESGAVLSVARVRLDDGRLVTVAEANLEVWG